MGKHDSIDSGLQSFIESQQMFFVATAPAVGGHVNLSPKGLDTFRIIGPRTVIYLDYIGSGAETIAHLRDSGRIAIMFCAFDGPPNIVRLQGRGEALEPQDPEYSRLRGMFPDTPTARSIIKVSVDRISDSCGFGVPLYEFKRHRDQLAAWANHKGDEGLLEYQMKKNQTSVDGLPGLRWAQEKGSDDNPAT
jgi:Pyridoxamine 5'-phosphate oxidase